MAGFEFDAGDDLDGFDLADDAPPRIYNTTAERQPIPAPPCSGCRRWRDCKLSRLVCESFELYVADGKWPLAVKQPSHRRYLKMYGDDDVVAKAARLEAALVSRPAPASPYTLSRLVALTRASAA